MSSNSRRVSSRLWPETKAWNWSARISISPATNGPGVLARAAAAAAADDRLDPRHHLLRVRRLRDPVVGAEPQAANPLGDGRALGADDDAEVGQHPADPLEELPAERPEDRDVDEQGVQLHRHELLGRHARRRGRGTPSRRRRSAARARAGSRCRCRLRRDGLCRAREFIASPRARGDAPSSASGRPLWSAPHGSGARTPNPRSQDFHTQILGFFTPRRRIARPDCSPARSSLSCSARLLPAPSRALSSLGVRSRR